MRKILLLSAAISVALSITAQSNGYFSVNSDGLFMHVKKLETTSGFVTLGTNSAGGVKDLQVTKWDEFFNPVWSFKTTDNSLGSAGNSTINQFVEANDGAFYITAQTANFETVIFKLSNNGALLWQKKYTGSGSLIAQVIQKAAPGDNGFLFGTGNCSYTNTLVKCDASGNVEWTKTYPYTLAQGVISIWGIINDGQGYIITSGLNGNSIINTKVDLSGTILSYKAYKHSTKTLIPKEVIKSGSNIVVRSDFNGMDNKRFGLTTFDNALNLSLYTEINNTNNDDIYALSVASINNGQNVIVSGMTFPNIYNLFILNLNSSGTIIWKHRAQAANTTPYKQVQFNSTTVWGNKLVSVGDGNKEGPFFSIMDNNGSGLCTPLTLNASSSNLTLDLLNGVLNQANLTSITPTITNFITTNVVSYTKTLYCGAVPNEVNEMKISNDNISVYPNPASDKVNIVFRDRIADATNVEIFDTFGRIVLLENIANNVNNIDVSNLTKGMYLIKIKNNNSEVVTKFMKD